MFIIKKIVLEVAVYLSNLKDKYRVGYYKYVYKSRVQIANDFILGKNSTIVMHPDATDVLLTIKAKNVFRKFCIITLDAAGKMTLGENNFFNNNCSLNCLGKLCIGNNNLFGENVKIYDHNHIFNRKDILVRDQGFRIGEVIIGDNCWIGSNCTILNNVIIGDNVVIGANCLISKSIPSNTIVRYVPDNSLNNIKFI